MDLSAKKISGLLIILSVFFTGCEKQPVAQSENSSPSHSPATAVELSNCENLYKVSDQFYRGAQPDAEGFRQLEKLGIKTVVSLRAFHSDRDKLKGLDLNYLRIPMHAWNPKTDQVHRFLTTVTDPNNQPVFVHCLHGADRTGTMTAVYRIVIEDWTAEKAIDEMTKGPFGFHEIFDGLPEFIQDLDLPALRKEFAYTPNSKQ